MCQSISDVAELLAAQQYICDPELATVIYLCLKMEKPLFLEGEPGVGKTEVAKALATGLQRPLIRLQCYEGLDITTAVYEWNYSKQLFFMKAQETSAAETEPWKNIFTEDCLIERPLLKAIRQQAQGESPVLLIDELDRADVEFEAFLLELLSEFQITIPELGTIRAERIPMVVITSNRTRELHDAVKRRCLYHWIDYPDPEKEYRILSVKRPGMNEDLARRICRFMEAVRSREFLKRPGIAETLDWAQALLCLHRDHLDTETVKTTRACLFKYYEDRKAFDNELRDILHAAGIASDEG